MSSRCTPQFVNPQIWSLSREAASSSPKGASASSERYDTSTSSRSDDKTA